MSTTQKKLRCETIDECRYIKKENPLEHMDAATAIEYCSALEMLGLLKDADLAVLRTKVGDQTADSLFAKLNTSSLKTEQEPAIVDSESEQRTSDELIALKRMCQELENF